MLTPERYAQAVEAFHEAMSLPADQRAEFVERTLNHDIDLRDEVLQLLASESADATVPDPFSDHRLGVAAMHAVSMHARAPMDEAPTAIARYRVVRTLGEGGMGRVYEAMQESPRRRVAVKIVRPEIDSPEVARRFALEAEILGVLRHPCIAQIMEAGTFEYFGRSRAFYAMEYVEGEPLLAYAEAAQLSTRARLMLFASICDGVQHAHLHGIVHRDLKPANILVDSAGNPKILDFGVARLLSEADVSGHAAQTQRGQLIGTFAYMSPEQIEGRVEQLDVRSDVWALGVIAFELLSGQMPFVCSSASVAEVARRSRDEEPRRLATMSRTFRGDVDTIVGKCLQHDPAARYASAGELAADVRRFLSDEPISARPPSSLYQISKFAKRNRGLSMGLAVAAIALIAGTSLAVWQAIEARRASIEARAEASRATSISEVLFEILTSGISVRSAGKETTVREALEEASTRLDHQQFIVPPTPAAEGVVRHALGMVYRDEGRYADAERECRRSLELRRSTYPPDHPQVAAGLRAVALVLLRANRDEEAVPFFREELAILRKNGTREQVAQSLHNLAAALVKIQGEHAEASLREADSILAEAIPMHRELYTGKSDDLVGMEVGLLGRLRVRQGRLQEAQGLLDESLSILRHALPEHHPRIASALNSLGMLQLQLSQPDKAEKSFREAIEIARDVYKLDDHPQVMMIRKNLEDALAARSRKVDAPSK